MQKHIFLSVCTLVALIAPVAVQPAHALSCLPVDMYLKDIVGKEEVVIFTGTVTDQIDEDGYTAEVVDVTEAKQGFIESEVFAYHQKDETWGYLCNNGPAGEGSEGLFVATRDANNKYTIHQRLELSDPLVETLEEDLADAEVEGGISELSTTDRTNQLTTAIMDLITEIQTLMKQLLYWKAQ